MKKLFLLFIITFLASCDKSSLDQNSIQSTIDSTTKNVTVTVENIGNMAKSGATAAQEVYNKSLDNYNKAVETYNSVNTKIQSGAVIIEDFTKNTQATINSLQNIVNQ